MNHKIYTAIETVLEFVERYNKGDKEGEVATAAQELQDFYIHSITKVNYVHQP